MNNTSLIKKNLRVALVYDRVNKWGGAERVLLALHELFPDAPLYTSVYSRKKTPWANAFSIKPSFLQSYQHAVENHEIYPFLMPISFENFSFDEYDLVISLTSEAAKGILTKPHTKHICYCLTPTRYLWSGYDDYFKNPALRTLSKPIVSYLKKWDKTAAHRPDIYVAISKEVQRRIKKYYQLNSVVIYPPIEINTKVANSVKKSQEELFKNPTYFLLVSRISRFTSYKKVDLAIEVCTKLNLPLKIVGIGSWEKKLKKLAGPTIEFLGGVSDEKLVDLYKGCQALIFPALEDFGLTILEAQKYGKPVIAFKGGGAIETIIDKKTGIFFEEQTVDSLSKAIKRFKSMTFDEKSSVAQAERFSKAKFQQEFLALVNKIV